MKENKSVLLFQRHYKLNVIIFDELLSAHENTKTHDLWYNYRNKIVTIELIPNDSLVIIKFK